MPGKYTVYVNDNYHYMDESERYKLGEFEDCRAAVAACQRIVDEFLSQCSLARTAEELFDQYKNFGEDPWIGADDAECRFSAWDYARARCQALARPLGGAG